ncbi:MAG: hypothetical protein R8F63_16280 [Acidimicrobiales bacterium]|nr:hypothetical protein [Acidimicrobiales bacterium]
MTATVVNPTPLLDGPRRSVFAGLVMLVLLLITVDGLLTWVTATDADEAIDAFVARHEETYPTGLGDTGNILLTEDRPVLAAATDGDRLDTDLVRNKTYLAIIGLIAAVALTISAGPGSSRNILAWMIVIAAGAFFVPLAFFSDTIEIVTNAHAG